jgi:hypothetical protein
MSLGLLPLQEECLLCFLRFLQAFAAFLEGCFQDLGVEAWRGHYSVFAVGVASLVSDVQIASASVGFPPTATVVLTLAP